KGRASLSEEHRGFADGRRRPGDWHAVVAIAAIRVARQHRGARQLQDRRWVEAIARAVLRQHLYFFDERRGGAHGLLFDGPLPVRVVLHPTQTGGAQRHEWKTRLAGRASDGSPSQPSLARPANN